MKVYFGLGSNLGDREKNLNSAIEILSKTVEITKQSSVYETEPVGYEDQTDFLNMVLEVKTDLFPDELLKLAKKIEADVGRKPTFKDGPREIDVDILLYGDLNIETDELNIPHPQVTERAFVLKPLFEIAPELKLPDGRAIKNIDMPGQDIKLLLR